jgi:hypothetical protein
MNPRSAVNAKLHFAVNVSINGFKIRANLDNKEVGLVSMEPKLILVR